MKNILLQIRKLCFIVCIGWCNIAYSALAPTTVLPFKTTKLNWNAVTKNLDGSAVTNPVTYVVYCGTEKNVYTWNSADLTVTTYDLINVPFSNGILYCSVRTTSPDGSTYSNIISLVLETRYLIINGGFSNYRFIYINRN